jgi:hypothetical protein
MRDRDARRMTPRRSPLQARPFASGHKLQADLRLLLYLVAPLQGVYSEAAHVPSTGGVARRLADAEIGEVPVIAIADL